MTRTMLIIATGLVAVFVTSGALILTLPQPKATTYSSLPIPSGAVLDFAPSSLQPNPIVFNVTGNGGQVVGVVYADESVIITIGSPNARLSCYFGCPPLYKVPMNVTINESLVPGTYGMFFYTDTPAVTVTRTIQVVYSS